MKQKWSMTITDVLDDEDKCVIEVELDEDFEAEFMEACGLKRWSGKKFNKWFKNILWRTLLTLEKGGYETIYSRYAHNDIIGHVEDIQVGDTVSFIKINRGEHSRIAAEVHEKYIMTEPMWENDKALKVKFSDITNVVRGLT